VTQPSRFLFHCKVAAVFVVAVVLLAFLRARAEQARPDLLRPTNVSAREQMLELGSTVVLGGFRVVPAVALSYRAGRLKERREWAELDGTIRMIATVQPTDISSYTHLIWDMAYNVQYDTPTVVDGWRWVEKSVAFGERGADRNPNHPEVWRLYWNLGWVYYHRCGVLPDDRTRYFEGRVIEKHKKSPFLVAADWFEKAWVAATEEPGAKSPNVFKLSMWAYAHEHYARRLEKEGKFDEMADQRNKAIAVHRKVMVKFPDYAEDGMPAIAELRKLIELHRGWQRARELRDEPTKELDLRRKLTGEWIKLLRQHPSVEEYQRNVDRSADGLEDVASRLIDPAARKSVQREVLALRYVAAEPGWRSAEATQKLLDAVAPYDERLGPTPSREDLLANAGLIVELSRDWVRIVVNSTGDAERARQAERAVRRFDLLYEALPEDQRGPNLVRLAQHWHTLVMASGRNIPRARQRIREGAIQQEAKLAAKCRELKGHLGSLAVLKQSGAPPDQLQKAASAVAHASIDAHALVDQVGAFWTTLLRKDAEYAEDARIAEKHLNATATVLDDVIAMARAVIGQQDDASDRRDPRSLVYPARSIWQMLREFDPRNIHYLRKAGVPVQRKRRGPANIHDLQPKDGPGHEGHDH